MAKSREPPSDTHCTSEFLEHSLRVVRTLSERLQSASPAQVLTQLDNEGRTDFSSGLNATLSRDMDEIMKAFTQSVASIQPRHAGALVSTGSVADGIKVGAGNEFDYVYILNEMSDRRFISINTSNMFCGRLEPRHGIASYNAICKTFDKAMALVDLPSGWSHGGLLQPDFGGHAHLNKYEGGSPACTFHLVYTHSGQDGAPRDEHVTFDVSPATPVAWAKVDPSVRDFLENRLELMPTAWRSKIQQLYNDEGVLAIPWRPSQLPSNSDYNVKLSLCIIEKHVLSMFPNDGCVKRAMRILKVLRDDLLTVSDTREEWATTSRPTQEDIQKQVDEIVETCGDDISDEAVFKEWMKRSTIDSTFEYMSTIATSRVRNIPKNFFLEGTHDILNCIEVGRRLCLAFGGAKLLSKLQNYSSGLIKRFASMPKHIPPALLSDRTGYNQPLVKVNSYYLKTAMLRRILLDQVKTQPEHWTDNDLKTLVIDILIKIRGWKGEEQPLTRIVIDPVRPDDAEMVEIRQPIRENVIELLRLIQESN